jgi:probable HAF family extracellular repeat protein
LLGRYALSRCFRGWATDLGQNANLIGSMAFGVSGDGAVVVGMGLTDAPTYEAFRWTAEGGMVSLGDLPGGLTESVATGASIDGSRVVGVATTREDAHQNEAFLWTSSGGMVGLGTLGGGDFSTSEANAISADGSVVAGTSDGRAFRWTFDTGMIDLGTLAGHANSAGYGVSAGGEVIVGTSTVGPSGGFEAFRWTQAGGMVGLGDLPGGASRSRAAAVSADGSVVVGAGSSAATDPDRFEAFRWTEQGGMVALGDLAGGRFDSTATAVSGDGSVVVGYGSTAAGYEAFIWDAQHGMRELDQYLIGLGADLTGWSGLIASDISDDGLTIVGRGGNPSGQNEAWIAVIPEPATGWLLGFGLLSIAWRRRPRARS